jgi:hypothetical protein
MLLATALLSILAINLELHVRLGIAGASMLEDMIMRRVVGTTLAGALLFGLGVGMVGCSEETGSKEEVKVTTPGGTATRTDTTTIKRSGENPPMPPSDTAKP